MNHSHLFSSITGYVISLSIICIGLAVLIRKKPLIFSYKWFVFFFAFLFLPMAIRDFSYPIDIMTVVFPVLMLVVLAYYYFIMKGVMVLGADGDDFQKVFISVLTEGNYRYEQTFTSIKIAEPALEISIAFQSWVGSGQMRLRNKENKETFNKIISQLMAKDIKPNLIIPIFYLIFGAILLFMDLSLWGD